MCKAYMHEMFESNQSFKADPCRINLGSNRAQVYWVELCMNEIRRTLTISVYCIQVLTVYAPLIVLYVKAMV
jgi:hypothetical protein